MREITACRAPWAKSPNADGVPLSLEQHLEDAADMADWLLINYLPTSLITPSAGAEWSGDLLRKVIVWLAGVHDLGKSTPAFVDVIPSQRAELREMGLASSPLSHKVHHSVTGYFTVRNWLRQVTSRHNAEALASVVLAHHGRGDSALVNGSLAPPEVFPEAYGDQSWSDERLRLILRAMDRSGLTVDDLRSAPRLEPACLPLIEAVVIMADWLASNEAFFPYRIEADRLESAVGRMRFPSPWEPSLSGESVEEIMGRRFPRAGQALKPRPSQHALVEAARRSMEPPLLILEAPPGEGKTEAALMAAEVLAERFGRTGIYFGLPTQATSSSLFRRVLGWLHTMEDELGGGVALSLLHGKRNLDPSFSEMTHRSVRGVGERDDEGLVHVHDWFSRRQASLLSTIGVGTVDQALMGALPSKHVMLRHAGLASKVVVVDEVHAYDDYMQAHLQTLLGFLGTYGTPVILLSATLPPAIKSALISAYTSGPEHPSPDTSYPLVTTASKDGIEETAVQPSSRSQRFALRSARADELGPLLSTLLSEGGTALVVRNTVSGAVKTARELEGIFGPGQVTCTHSRFLATHRAQRDQWLVDTFGSPDRLLEAGTQRPDRHIVVATQVVEQSLDVDFDVLLTDLAPVDLIIQRMGRCHRHERGSRPVTVSRPQCFILTPWGVDPNRSLTLDPGSETVYGRRDLMSSAAVLLPHIGAEVRLPEDIIPLVHGAYAETVPMPERWQVAFTEACASAREDRERNANLARDHALHPVRRSLKGWWNGEPGSTPERPMTRLDDGRSITAVIIRQDADGRWSPYADPAITLPREGVPGRAEQVAMEKSTCSIRLPNGSMSEVYAMLGDNVPPSWRGHPFARWLNLVVLDENGQLVLEKTRFMYSPRWGMEVETR